MNENIKKLLNQIEQAIESIRKELLGSYKQVLAELSLIKEFLEKTEDELPVFEQSPKIEPSEQILTKEIEEAKAQLEHLKNELSETLEKNQKLSDDCNNLRTRLSQQSQEIISLQNQLQTAQTEITRLNTELTQTLQKISEQDFETLQKKLAEETQKRLNLETELAIAKRDLEEAIKTPSLQDVVQQLREELAEALRQRDEARTECIQLRRKLEEIQSIRKESPQITVEFEDAFRTIGPDGSRLRLGDILRQAGVITQQQLDEALMTQVGAPHRKLGDILVEKGFTGEDVIARVLAKQLGVPFVKLTEQIIEPAALRELTPKIVKLHQCLPIRVTKNEITVAMSNPLDLIAIDDIELTTGKRVLLTVATKSDLEAAIAQYYG